MYRETLIRAAHAGAAILKENFNTSFIIKNKEGINNLVTEIDHACEKAIIQIIQKAFPEHKILSEECGLIEHDGNYQWIIDPIDGTVNFAHSIPICCVSIALEKDGEIIMGAVYNPLIEEFFFAEKNKGAYLNDQKIHVSNNDDITKSCLATGFPYKYLDQKNNPLDVFNALIRKGIPVRRLGSAAIDLCYVACGRFDGFYEHSLQPWDTAAGFLMVKEANGQVTNLTGEPYNPYQHGLVSSNGRIHTQLLKYICQ
ncbi:MAG: inositol monophosphatase [Bacteroidetes bacterium]|nr:inositol monophosphatase [Bacteroidota bacterium]